MSKEENVIQFDGIVTVIERQETDQPEPTMDIVTGFDEGHRGYCPHEKVVLYIHHRILQCKKCNKRLDPFDFVRELARISNNHITSIAYIKHQLKWLERDKQKLENEVKNLKAQKRKYSL